MLVFYGSVLESLVRFGITVWFGVTEVQTAQLGADCREIIAVTSLQYLLYELASLAGVRPDAFANITSTVYWQNANGSGIAQL